ncbi:MAG: ankyrin repeat domain-containing protein [Candidatus Babeliales bacterium]
MNRIYFIIMAFFCTIFTCYSMEQKIKIDTHWPHQISAISLLDERLTVDQATELIKTKNVNACSIFFKTPLHIAVERNHKELTNFLIANSAKKNFRDWQGKTPLFYAVKNRNMELIEILLKAGASIEITNNKKETLIGYAEAKGIQLEKIQNQILNKNNLTSLIEPDIKHRIFSANGSDNQKKGFLSLIDNEKANQLNEMKTNSDDVDNEKKQNSSCFSQKFLLTGARVACAVLAIVSLYQFSNLFN